MNKLKRALNNNTEGRDFFLQFWTSLNTLGCVLCALTIVMPLYTGFMVLMDLWCAAMDMCYKEEDDLTGQEK